MQIVVLILQILAALLYGASGIMKVFMFDKISKDVPSFKALPKGAWTALGILELICVAGLVLPMAFHVYPALIPIAAGLLALESLAFIYVHIKSREIGTLVFSTVLGLLMAFIAYWNSAVHPV